MTVCQLQKDLVEDIEETLSGMLFKDSKGNLVRMKAYCQDVPKRQHEMKAGAVMPEEEEDPYPFCVVRAESGGMFNGSQRVSIVLIIAVFNDDMQNQGQQELLNIFHRLAERFIKNPVLKDKYRLVQGEGISWILDDEDRYPYFIGGMAMKWDTFFTEREDVYV